MTTKHHTHNDFHYAPLAADCIRLLEFLPPEPDSEPRLRLINNVPFDQSQLKYTALSYCWGDSYDTLSVTVDGHVFNVTRNLHEALVAIVNHHAGVVEHYLWVDSICTNQGDDEEKGHQVSKMWRIFQAAHRVFAWLGPEEEREDEMWHAVQKIRQLLGKRSLVHSDEDYHKFAIHPARLGDAELLDRCRAIVTEAERHKDYGVLSGHGLLDRVYFSRVWMITECVQARELIFACGQHSCTWEELEFYVQGGPGPIQARQWHHQNLCNSKGFQGPPELDQMWDCLHEYSEAQCTDLRDHVYAMLGHPFIKKLDPQNRLKVDYSLTNEELYIVTLSWIDEVYGHIRDDFTGYHPEVFAGEYTGCLRRGLNINSTPEDIKLFIASHDDWAWEPACAHLVLSNGREVDCSGPILQHLINNSRASEHDGQE